MICRNTLSSRYQPGQKDLLGLPDPVFLFSSPCCLSASPPALASPSRTAIFVTQLPQFFKALCGIFPPQLRYSYSAPISSSNLPSLRAASWKECPFSPSGGAQGHNPFSSTSRLNINPFLACRIRSSNASAPRFFINSSGSLYGSHADDPGLDTGLPEDRDRPERRPGTCVVAVVGKIHFLHIAFDQGGMSRL